MILKVDLPAIELEVDNSSGTMSGTMLFYFQERSDPSQPWHVTRGVEPAPPPKAAKTPPGSPK